MRYLCCESERREATLNSALNGLDFLEVLDHDAPNDTDRQKILLLHFLKPVGGLGLTADNIRIMGGERIKDIAVEDLAVEPAPNENIGRVRLDRYGDFSRYTLSIVRGIGDNSPPIGLDPRLAAVEFSFKVQCPSEFDCKPDKRCPLEPVAPEALDYLARDYPTFRRLMLDRMAVTAPGWTERNPADLGVTLVELLAYAADQISYQQDSVTTEAYLETARRRTSIRRHARLMDYHVSDGCNARTWVHLKVSADQAAPPNGTRFLSQLAGQTDSVAADDPRLYREGVAVFEQLEAARLLRTLHNEIHFYSWSEAVCCLPRGATAATLHGALPDLDKGDVLLIEEVKGAGTGAPADADITHRAVVRLTKAGVGADPVTLEAVTNIEWHADDALPFPVCVSSIGSAKNVISDISVVRGNMLLADHGLRVVDEPIGSVPEVQLRYALAAGDHCDPPAPEPVAPRFRPTIAKLPLTHAAAYASSESARAQLEWSSDTVRPVVELTDDQGQQWTVRRDLLSADSNEYFFMVEVESSGDAFIRFGDAVNGKQPTPGTAFRASYRVGNGKAGNIGADALQHIAGAFTDIEEVRNPLPASGGRNAETIEEIRQRVPIAYRTQERAVTTEDYADKAETFRHVQKAAATLRWTGSWHTAFITVDQDSGQAMEKPFREKIRAHVDRYRMAGHDLNINEPRYVSLELELFVCCEPHYLRSDVKRALLEELSAVDLPDGRRGLFHPDNFTFGQSVYLSAVYAAAQSVVGVASVDVRVFRRQGDVADTQSIANGILPIGRLEIVRLQNDPNFVERGVLRIEMGGGR